MDFRHGGTWGPCSPEMPCSDFRRARRLVGTLAGLALGTGRGRHLARQRFRTTFATQTPREAAAVSEKYDLVLATRACTPLTLDSITLFCFSPSSIANLLEKRNISKLALEVAATPTRLRCRCRRQERTASFRCPRGAATEQLCCCFSPSCGTRPRLMQFRRASHTKGKGRRGQASRPRCPDTT